MKGKGETARSHAGLVPEVRKKGVAGNATTRVRSPRWVVRCRKELGQKKRRMDGSGIITWEERRRGGARSNKR